MVNPKVRTSVLTCPDCGARLRWDGDAPVIECRYCQTHVAIDTGRKTDQPATVISKGATPLPLGIILVGTTVFTVAIIAFSMLGGRRTHRAPPSSSPAERTATTAEIARTPIASRPQEVAARFGAPLYGTSVLIAISDGPFNQAQFHWDKDHLEHADSISLRPRDGADLNPVIARARSQIGRQFRQTATNSHQFGSQGVGFALSSTLYIGAHKLDDPKWKERLAAMWTVMKHAGLGTDDRLDDQVKRELLNLSYPLTVLNEIGFDVEVDGAEREVHRVAPGAESRGEHHVLGIDHQWIESASLSWENKAGGKWSSVTLYFPVEFDFKKRHGEIIACLAPMLGEPRKLVSDHLAGRFSLQYRARGGWPWLDVSDQIIGMQLRYAFGDPVTAVRFRALIKSLRNCGN